MRAARWMGVPPWELAGHSVVWMRWALLADKAERELMGPTQLFGR